MSHLESLAEAEPMQSARSSDPVLRARDLRVERPDGSPILDDVSLTVGAQEIVAVVGESGSGKTTLALALLGAARRGVQIVGGSVKVAGQTVDLQSDARARRVRGSVISYVPQQPRTSLDPSMRVGQLLAEMARTHGVDHGRPALREAFARLRLPDQESFLDRYPHQLSGGQLQRVAIAIALVSRPKVLVLDEPTTGLDVITQAGVLEELLRLRAELGLGMVYVSHDLSVVARLADRVVVVFDGQVVEEGPTADVLQNPQDAYTKRLLDSVPGRHRRGEAGSAPRNSVQSDRVLEVEAVRIVHRSGREHVVAADNVSFSVSAGQCLAVVGESGSGKTSIARALIGIQHVESGTVRLHGTALKPTASRRSLDERRAMQIVFQDPADALNPRHSAAAAIARPLRLFRGLRGRAADAEVDREMDRVHLSPRLRERYPGELSGGELQRLCIARALAADPTVLICDEVTSALDVSVQASILKLLLELRASSGLSLLFITHDLTVVDEIADHVLVLDSGQVVEDGPVDRILTEPRSDYTRRLLAAAPRLPDLNDRKEP